MARHGQTTEKFQVIFITALGDFAGATQDIA